MLLFVVVMPLLTSVVVRTFAWIVILGREGVVNQLVLGLGLAAEPLRLLQTELGLVISLTQIEMPLLLLPLLAVMSRIDPNLMRCLRLARRLALADAVPGDPAAEPCPASRPAACWSSPPPPRPSSASR